MNNIRHKKINILQLITGLGVGGAERVVFDLSKTISKDDFNVYVASLSNRDDLLKEFISAGIDTTVFRQSNSFLAFFLLIGKVHLFIKRNKILVIHAHMAHSIIIASFVKLLYPSLKIVFSSHSLNIGSKFREVLVWILKAFRNIDIISSKDILKFFYKDNYKVVPYGINIEKYNLNLVKNKRFTFISVGRLEAVKNHLSLLKIAHNLRKKYNFEIQIVGSGPLLNKLKTSIEQYGLNDTIKVLGLRRDIPELLNKAHCLLMPSLWEGFPIVILEASASNLPIITTPVGSIPSVLNNKNSCITEVKHFENAMMKTMDEYNNSKEKSEILFQEINEKHSISSFVRRHELIYTDLISV